VIDHDRFMVSAVTFVSLLFPRITQLDLTGPVEVFSRLPGAVSHLAWHRVEPVPTDAGFSIVPTVTFADAPQADVLMVPGGQGAFDLLDDPDARYVTSVCTGSFVLGAAGLLRGRRATTHWASHPMLELLDATPVAERVVRDGNLITGGGVTSGIDFALTVAAEVFDAPTAQAVQLAMEYDPRPPFDAGTPSGADADPAFADGMRAWAITTRESVVQRAAARLP
jgi:cyclohexyl-isocyanide hydratase